MEARTSRAKPSEVDGGRSSIAHGPEAPVSGEPRSVSGSAQPKPCGIQNADTTSIPFTDGKNPYLNRPLPPPPPSKTAAMSERPSMSAGSSYGGVGLGIGMAVGSGTGGIGGGIGGTLSSGRTFSSSKRNFEKRRSRDDLYLDTRDDSRPARLTSYHIPIRGLAPPTPDYSPSLRSNSPFRATPTSAVAPAATLRVYTPESSRGTPSAAEIGMALGSPTQGVSYTTYPAWEPQSSSQMARTASPDNYESSDSGAGAKHKTSKGWKLFGVFGGSKKKPERDVMVVDPQPPSTSYGNYGSSNNDYARPTTSYAAEKAPARSNTSAGGKKTAPRYQPIVVRSNTEPWAQSPRFEASAPAPAPAPASTLLKSKASAPAMREGRSDPPEERAAPAAAIPMPSTIPPIGASPYLDVEIPDIRMERYSVMFGSLLNPQPASSLLARRQATLDKLKNINDAIVREENERAMLRVRRATSPQPTKSPVFTLFPPTPSHGANKNAAAAASAAASSKPSPRMRSNTSPAVLPSPSKATFDHGLHHHIPRKEVPSSSSSSSARSEIPPVEAPPQREPAQEPPSVAAAEVARKPQQQAPKVGYIPRNPYKNRDPNSTKPLERRTPTPDMMLQQTQQQQQQQHQHQQQQQQQQQPTREAQASAKEDADDMLLLQEQKWPQPPVSRLPVIAASPAEPPAAVAAAAAAAVAPVSASTSRSRRQRQQEQTAEERAQLQQQAKAFNFGPDESGLILDSPTSVSGEDAPAAPRERDVDAVAPTAAVPAAAAIAAPSSSSQQQPQYSSSTMPSGKPILRTPNWGPPPNQPPTSSLPAPSGPTTTSSVSPPASSASSSVSSAAVSASSSRSSSTSGGRRKRTSPPSSVSSAGSNNHYHGQQQQQHVAKPSIDESDTALKAAVEISIARQISLSQQQRQLLQPLKGSLAADPTTNNHNNNNSNDATAASGIPRPSASASSGGAGGGGSLPATSGSMAMGNRAMRPSPVNTGAAKASAPTGATAVGPVGARRARLGMGRNERLAATRKNNPVLVQPRPATVESQMLEHRKSEKIVVEVA